MLNDYADFLRDVVLMQAYPLIEFNLGSLGIDLIIFFFNLLLQLIDDFIVGVVLQYIQNKAFFDVDVILENQFGCSITDFVEKFGWPAFREKEFDAVKQLLTQNQEAVIAPGGGFFTTQEKVDFAKAHAHCIFLNTPLPTIIERLSALSETAHRPLLNNQPLSDKLQELYSERLPFYTQAHARLD